MSQLTIYLRKEEARVVRESARKSKRSVSEWARERLLSGGAAGWPPGYFELLGALRDDSMRRPEQPSPALDAARKAL